MKKVTIADTAVKERYRISRLKDQSSRKDDFLLLFFRFDGVGVGFPKLSISETLSSSASCLILAVLLFALVEGMAI